MAGVASSRRAGVLAVIALLALTGSGVAVAAGRQVAADLSFKPIKVPAASPAASGAASALAAVTAAPTPAASPSGVPEPSAAGIASAVSGLLTASVLGGKVAAQILDPASKQVLFSANQTTPVAPASTLKLLTATAVLTVHKPTDRIATKVVQGSEPGEVVLVGAGDPTLSGAESGAKSRYEDAARITDLAKAVRASLGAQPVTKVVVDGSLFTGPNVAPGWQPTDVPTDYASPITAALVDGGRNNPEDVVRSATPDIAAGEALAAALGGATVSRGTGPAGAKVLGTVNSAPYGRLVEEMLTESDNVLAEVLGRQVALAAGQPASFAGAAASIAATLQPLGITVGTATKDASGLSVLDRIPAQALADALVRALDPSHPELYTIITGLPVAGWSGTLESRYTGDSAAGQGVVRAKTGTLDGVSALAGIVRTKDGRTLVLVLVANHVPIIDADIPRAALDAVAARLALCGCR